MILLAGLLDVLFRAIAFVGLALAAGGVVFDGLVLRPAVRAARGGSSADPVTYQPSLRRCAGLTALGAFAVALAQGAALVVAPWALADEAGDWPMREFLATGFARAAITHAGAALLLALAALYQRSHASSLPARLAVGVLALLTLASGGPLTHGASRLDHPALLMTLTVVHQLPSAAWVGGVAHLVAQWRLVRAGAARETLWPRMLARFSPLAAGCVALLLAAGLYLTWRYVGDPGGLVGTAYGTMLLTKVALTFTALLLAAANLATLRRWRATGDTAGVQQRIPVLLEAEAAVGVCLLMAAAAFTSQPPAVDVTDGRASAREVARVFAPKAPQFTMPPLREVVTGSRSTLDPYSLPTEVEKLQSNFNHNTSGAFVLLAAVGALVYAAGAKPARHWPLVLVLLGVFVLVIAEPTVWPLGHEPFWATLRAPEVLVHRLAAVLVMGLGLFEWRVRAGGLARTNARYVFPLLCFAGGALMLTHSHSVFATKWAFLIEVSHNALGILAVLAGAARWLELRLPAREGRLAGAVWPACLALTGLVLIFYRET